MFIWSLCYLLVRCLLQLALLRPRSQGLQGTRDRRASARARGPSAPGAPSAAEPERSGLPRCGESANAALAMEVVSGDADDAAALAPAPSRSPLDVRRSPRPATDRRRDPRVGTAARPRESALGLPTNRRRAERPRFRRVRYDGEEDPARSWPRPGLLARWALVARLPTRAGEEHARGRFLHCRDDLAAAAVRALLHRARQPSRAPAPNGGSTARSTTSSSSTETADSTPSRQTPAPTRAAAEPNDQPPAVCATAQKHKHACSAITYIHNTRSAPPCSLPTRAPSRLDNLLEEPAARPRVASSL